MLNQNFWKKYFKTYDILNKAIPYQELVADIVSALDIKQGELIFDAGSGTGNVYEAIKNKGAVVKGLDFSEAGISIHKEKDSEAEVVFGDLTQKLPFPDCYFDKIVSNNVLYTLENDKRESVLLEFKRVLKPGGFVVLSNLHKRFNSNAILVDHIKKSLRKEGFLRTIIELLKFGFSVIKMMYYNKLIKDNDRSGKGRFMEEGEQSRLLKNAGFQIFRETKLTYSKQSFLDVGKKI